VPGDEQPSILLTRQYSGSEDIDLLEGIKSRVVTLDQEADVESIRPRRPSLFSRHRSGSNVSMKSGDRASRGLPGRSQITDGSRPEFSRKSFSDNAPNPFVKEHLRTFHHLTFTHNLSFVALTPSLDQIYTHRLNLRVPWNQL
jgi:hypothetical protein